MKIRRTTIDGVLAGTELRSDVNLKSSEIARIRKILIANDAQEQDGGLSVAVALKAHGPRMVISLRTHYHDKSKFFLNISGNPLTFLTHSNTYGYAEADRVIITAYRKALEALGPNVPPRIYSAIADRNINIHSLEFAAYTNKVGAKTQLLNDWAHVYQSAYSSPDGLVHTSLADLLDLQFRRKHKTHVNSVCLRILNKAGVEEEAMLLIYDKAREIRERLGIKAIVPADIENRLRLDLNLSQGWFRNKSINKKKLKTLRDLCDYVEKWHKGSWPSFIASEFEWALNRTCLFHMWSFKAESVTTGVGSKVNKRLNYSAYAAMLKARSLKTVSDSEWLAIINNKAIIGALVINPHPDPIFLDMEPI